MYRKPTFTGQYLNFNSHHPYTVKKGIVRCLQHRAKTISSDTDAYQEEMISLRHNLHRNNYPESITSAPRNLDRRMEDNTRKLTTVCLPYVKGLAERIKKICSPYDIRTVLTSGSTIRRYLFRVKPVRSSVKVPEFDKHLKKAGGHIDRNIVKIIIKMKTIVRKTLMIKIHTRTSLTSSSLLFQLCYACLARLT